MKNTELATLLTNGTPEEVQAFIEGMRRVPAPPVAPVSLSAVDGILQPFGEVTPEQVRAVLPPDFVAALTSFDKSEDEIYTYFANYHNKRSQQQVRNDVTAYFANTIPTA